MGVVNIFPIDEVFLSAGYMNPAWRSFRSTPTEDELWRSDLISQIFHHPGLLMDRFVQILNRLQNLEQKYFEFETDMISDIQLYCRKRAVFFEEIGGNLFDGKSFDRTPEYSRQDGHFVRLSDWKGRNVLEVIVHLSEIGEHEILFEEFFKRATLLSKFQEIAWLDLDRLWSKTHDGKACLYFWEGDRAPDAALDPCLPWYICQNNVDMHRNWAKHGSRGNECLFCCLDRLLYQLEYQIKRLQNYLFVWPNGRSLPEGAQAASQEHIDERQWVLL